MKYISIFTILILITFFSYSQEKHKVTYGQLKEYQGLYEYLNNTTLKIAASPIDTTLICIINESRYPFRTIGKDLFLNPTKDSILFFRNKFNKVTGYIVGKDTFNLLIQKMNFTKEMWYPRLTSSKDYKYCINPLILR